MEALSSSLTVPAYCRGLTQAVAAGRQAPKSVCRFPGRGRALRPTQKEQFGAVAEFLQPAAQTTG